MHDTHQVATTEPPPQTPIAILRRLGPGLIIAGSIVGSGELIATTKTGAEAGFALLWLIVIGCVIKVFVQVEFGRYAVCTGETSLFGMNEVPGPRVVVNWIVWYWLIMFLFGLAQLGGIVGGVGQALALSAPLTGDFKQMVTEQRAWDSEAAPLRERLALAMRGTTAEDTASPAASIKRLDAKVRQRMGRPRPSQSRQATRDDFYWATIMTVITAAVLITGRYGIVQTFSMVLVASFTVITIVNLAALQQHEAWSISLDDIRYGFSFDLPRRLPGSATAPLATALATFGIIGVGASEVISYPYWCLEKGYARFTGPRDASPGWAARAAGWLRVMRWDAWTSMVIYTFATVAFYLLGAAVLYRQGLNPEKDQLIVVLSEMYVPVFGRWAQVLFLFGAFAVLYSTFFVASAGLARVVADAVRIFRLGAYTPEARWWWTRVFCGVFPFASLLVYRYVRAPAQLVLASGVAQAIMLPMLGTAALYFRYRRCDARAAPGRTWDVLLWLSALGLLLAGTWAAISKLFPDWQLLG